MRKDDALLWTCSELTTSTSSPPLLSCASSIDERVLAKLFLRCLRTVVLTREVPCEKEYLLTSKLKLIKVQGVTAVLLCEVSLVQTTKVVAERSLGMRSGRCGCALAVQTALEREARRRVN